MGNMLKLFLALFPCHRRTCRCAKRQSFSESALSWNCCLGHLAACLFSSQFLLVFSLAFSCYFQEAAFRMASGFPDRTPPPPHTPHSSYRETMGGLPQGHEEAVCVCVC